ncbi:kynureninase [Candidatus Skiveiella danica]|jgi:kynureninase|uniref:kynureninase n=1 Tax=Candidatus Skiveiella danica TaxID=3386177 RepID=UPI0009CF5670|nr:kynureninase [Comamonadaceae bacterium]MBK9199614.1 kynureninase [Betaproteobacteria bacterium]MBP6308186.1 kynureninase [Burkholderiaceae bacterium]MBP6505082.1 kynureninase [Rhodoferax sp.]OQC08283.1 MAG: Kynureninase [Alphaproteobacteria bacterium ADurb.Bin100]
MTPNSLEDCRQADAQDPLRELRHQFDLPDGVIYLDGNSLGVLPRATAARVAKVVTQEWGQGLIRSWNTAGWFDSPRRAGDKIARLVGGNPSEVVATDSTSINLFKVLSAALNMAREDAPQRKTLVSERSNFPTDLYIAEALCRERGYTLKLVEPEAIAASLTTDVAVLMLTHVNYRTGAMHDMAAVTAAAHAAGILAVWDLAHSAGAVPVDLTGAQADFAVGCGYKYLNGGPGAPAFVWVAPRHAERFWQPLAGWWGHATPFTFNADYQPAPGITRYLCGTQPIISMAALECGLDTLLAVEPLGGMAALRAKSLALTDLFIELVETRCAGHGLTLATPRVHAQRGSQVCLARGAGAYAIVQALIARNVIGDFRAGDGGLHPDILRFGFTPLYIGFEDVWQAVEHLRQVLDSGEWQRPEFNQKHAVT